MLFQMTSRKIEIAPENLEIFNFSEFQEEFNFNLVICLLLNLIIIIYIVKLLHLCRIQWAIPENTPPPHYGRHLIGYLKISGFSRMTIAVFAGFQTLLILNIGEFQNFARLCAIPVRIHKVEIHGFPVKLTKHFLQDFQCRPWGEGWIFSGIAQYSLHNQDTQNFFGVISIGF